MLAFSTIDTNMTAERNIRATPDAAALKVPRAWVELLRAHASITRRMESRLLTSHGLTLSDYEVLLQLAHADGRRLRRVDLAQRVLITQSGITRLLEGLERTGFVEKAPCPSDRRAVYAQLTDAGHAKLREAAKTHLEDVRDLFAAGFSNTELETLATLLARVPHGGEGSGPEIDSTEAASGDAAPETASPRATAPATGRASG